MSQVLSALTAGRIAKRNGFQLRMVIGELKQARELHGKVAIGYNGKPFNNWSTIDGRYDAERLFTGYVEEISREAEIDAKAHQQFCRDAYGED